MSREAEIKKAIGAHGLWKTKLRNAMSSGRAEPPSAHAAADDVCDFGRWLYSLPQEERATGHFSRVRELHARFHQEAARVLALVESGNVPAAARAIETGSAFADVSRQLTRTLMEWSKAA